MSAEEMKEAIQNELGANQDEQNNEEQDQGVKETDPEHTEPTQDESTATSRGWVPKDQYKGSPDDWRSAKQFNEFGDLISNNKQMREQMRDQSARVEERIINLNIMHKGQLEAQMEQLNSQFNEAVDDRDTDRASSIRDQQVSVNKMLDQVETQPAITPSTISDFDSDILLQWNADNPWISANTDKARMAHHSYKTAMDQGKTISEAIDAANRSASLSDKPGPNQNRAAPSTVASGSNSGRKSGERSLSIADMTHQEMGMRGMFPTETAFLKAVQDSRKG